MTKIPKGLEAACHEAAHAIVSLALGKTFKCIRLREETRDVPDSAKALGATSAVGAGRCVPTDEIVYAGGALAEAKVALAGLAFEKLRRPWKTLFELSLSSCNSDSEHGEDWCRYHVTGRPSQGDLSGDEKLELARVYNRALRETRRLVRDQWDSIIRVGQALAERRELSQAEVEELLAAPPGITV
jgi:hypothetical protein